MKRIFFNFSILEQIFQAPWRPAGHPIHYQAANVAYLIESFDSISPPIEARPPGFWCPGAPIHLNRNNAYDFGPLS